MQRITNCIVLDEQRQEVLLLKKPRRGWWVAPGGKMEAGESISQSVIREYKEETGITLIQPQLRGVFSIIIEEQGNVLDEWMMFTFFTTRFQGEKMEESPEGELAWVSLKEAFYLPKAKGDQLYFRHILAERKKDIFIAKFRYTPEYELLDYEC